MNKKLEKFTTAILIFTTMVILATMLVFSTKLANKRDDYSGKYHIISSKISNVKIDDKKLIGDIKFEIKDKKAIVIVNNTKEEYKVKKIKDNELIFYNSSNKIKVDKENNTLKFKYNGIDLTLDRKE